RGRRVPLRLAMPVAALAVVAAGWAVLDWTTGSDAPRPVRVPPAVPVPQTGAPTPSASASAPVATASSEGSVTPANPRAASTSPTPSSNYVPLPGRRTPDPADVPPRTPPPAAGEGRRVG
ncbi:hypothetical protein ABZS54_42870, partial [Embleya sp. NPDC005575]